MAAVDYVRATKCWRCGAVFIIDDRDTDGPRRCTRCGQKRPGEWYDFTIIDDGDDTRLSIMAGWIQESEEK